MYIKRVAAYLVLVVMMMSLTPELASAQDREVSQTQPVELDVGQDDFLSDFRISGFGVGNFGYVSETNNNTFGATKLAISAFKRSGSYISFFAQLTTLFEIEGRGGLEEEEVHEEEEALGVFRANRVASSSRSSSSSGGEEGEGPVVETEIDNLILSVTTPGFTALTFWLGRFDAPIGFERDDEPLNFQPTTSFNFDFARPIKFTGLLARYVPIPELAVSAYLVNGWDVTLDNNKGKTVGGRVTFLPHEYAQISVNSVYGPEKEDNTEDKRLLVNGDFTVQPIHALILGGEFNYGTEENSALGGGDADWIGGQATGFVRFAPNFGVTLRYDILDDKNGARTGQIQTLQSFTLAPMLFYRSAVSGIFSTIPGTSFLLPEFQLRAGLRYNKSDEPFFRGEDELVEDNFEVILEGIFVF